MNIIKQFHFHGTFKKAHGDDPEPIGNLDAVINCYANGLVLLNADAIKTRAINEKFLKERIPYIQSNNSLLVYQGDYQIDGMTPEGWKLSAVTSGLKSSLSFSTNTKDLEKDKENTKIRLNNLCIDYLPALNRGSVKKNVYALSDLKVRRRLTTPFLNSEANFTLSPIQTEDSEVMDAVLTAEMTLENIKETEKETYDTYSTWFKRLLSFASGQKVESFYEIKTFQADNNEEKQVEYWWGYQPFPKNRELTVIERLEEFVCQVANEVTTENFDEKGLALALGWYIDSFESRIRETQYILICTALEALSERCSSKYMKELVFEEIYKQIRQKIINIINEEKQNVNMKELDDCLKSQLKGFYKRYVSKKLVTNEQYTKIQEKILTTIRHTRRNIDDESAWEKYDKFINKVEKSFTTRQYQQISHFEDKCKEMFGIYQVKYNDLFPNLEFIKVRNDITHKGYSNLDSSDDLFNLKHLFIRLVLSILKYQGIYNEQEKTGLRTESGGNIYTIRSKHFPLLDAEANFRQGWQEAITEETIPVSQLWEDSMQTESPLIQVEFTSEFKRNLFTLSNKYDFIRSEIQPIIDQLQISKFVGEQISESNYEVFKVNVSRGYRLIYYLRTSAKVILLSIYSKIDQEEISEDEIRRILTELDEA